MYYQCSTIGHVIEQWLSALSYFCACSLSSAWKKYIFFCPGWNRVKICSRSNTSLPVIRIWYPGNGIDVMATTSYKHEKCYFIKQQFGEGTSGKIKNIVIWESNQKQDCVIWERFCKWKRHCGLIKILSVKRGLAFFVNVRSLAIWERVYYGKRQWSYKIFVKEKGHCDWRKLLLMDNALWVEKAFVEGNKPCNLRTFIW